MKKLVILLVGVFVIAGCGVKEQFKADANLESIEGTLKEQTSVDKAKGTHFILNDKSEDVPVRSLMINLSSPEYLNNRVDVVGFDNDADGVFEVTGITVLEILNDSKIKGKLVEYKNSELGFQTKYYDNWQFVEMPGVVTFSFKLNETDIVESNIYVEQYAFDYVPETESDQTNVKALEDYFTKTNSLDIQPFLAKIGPDQMDAVRIQNESSLEYTLYRAGLIYKIKFVPAAGGDIGDILFKQVISEFKFIGFSDSDKPVVGDEEAVDVGSVPSVDMELITFESLPYHFSGKYPSSWYYAGSKSSNPQVLHHYGFSDQSVTSENELIGLDVLAGSIPSAGKDVTVAGRSMKEISSTGNYILYDSVDGQNYRFTGSEEYTNLIRVMAANVISVEN